MSNYSFTTYGEDMKAQALNDRLLAIEVRMDKLIELVTRLVEELARTAETPDENPH